MWVELHDTHVLKTPKTRKEVEKSVRRYVRFIGKPEEFSSHVTRVLRDIPRSLYLLKRSHLPPKYLAYPEFLERGVIKQKRVIPLEDEIRRLIASKKIKEARALINKALTFFMSLWQYGIHEKTFKLTSNFGIDGNQIVLLDFLELTGNKKKVEKQLRKKLWRNATWMKKGYPPTFIDYYLHMADTKLTLHNFRTLWKKNR